MTIGNDSDNAQHTIPHQRSFKTHLQTIKRFAHFAKLRVTLKPSVYYVLWERGERKGRRGEEEEETEEERQEERDKITELFVCCER